MRDGLKKGDELQLEFCGNSGNPALLCPNVGINVFQVFVRYIFVPGEIKKRNNGLKYGWMDGQMDGKTDGWTDRQREMFTNGHKKPQVTQYLFIIYAE